MIAEILLGACAVLTPQDAGRIQQALNLCKPGDAVVLKAGHYRSGQLLLPRRVTLFLDRGAVLSPTGRLPENKFIYSYQAAYSGVAGGGVIDGEGSPAELMCSYESTGFRINGISLRNGSGIHAAIYKTIGLQMMDFHIESNAGSGVLLSNAVDPVVRSGTIRVPGDEIALKNSILGPTTGVKIGGVTFEGGRGIVKDRDVREPESSDAPVIAILAENEVKHQPGTARALTVKAGESVQKAIDALPVTGGDITIKPGTYREVVTIRKPNVHLHGEDPDPAKTVIVYNNRASNSGGTFNTATVFVEADNVTIDHLSIVNDAGSGQGQAVALHVTGDRDTFRKLRIIGAQDTLFSASRFCYGDYGPCPVARQYFADCFIEGNTDFIFGDSKAVFDHCELHAAPTGQVMYTAQSRHTKEQDSGYIFVDCRFTGEPRNGPISLGRSWRPYATVVLLNAQLDAPIIPEGWTEWLRFGFPTLPTAYYAEYNSKGPGANPGKREKYSHQLTKEEAAKWDPKKFLAGDDNWNPK